jgi:hypothetical protein
MRRTTTSGFLPAQARASTGIAGPGDVLGGGLPATLTDFEAVMADHGKLALLGDKGGKR